MGQTLGKLKTVFQTNLPKHSIGTPQIFVLIFSYFHKYRLIATLTRPKSFIHLDTDDFYPAVEVVDNPDLKGKLDIIGGRKERGVVPSTSYEARRFGVHSAQPIATAMRLCPKSIDFETKFREDEVHQK